MSAPSSSLPHIEVRGLGRAYPGPAGESLEVLKEMSFTVGRGRFVSLLGPSGCGKSTLLHLIAGLDACTAGEIRIAAAAGEAGHSPRIGFVFQEPRLLAWRTVQRNVELPLESLPLAAEERRALARRYLERVGLQGFESYYPGQISGGMQQRVALARALVIDPEILLMDEPFSALDEMTAEGLRRELAHLWTASGKTILFVTHDLAEAVFLSERILLVTARPSRLFQTIAVDLPYPRRLEDPRLLECEGEVRRELRAMGS